MTINATEINVIASGTSMFPLIRDGMHVKLHAVPAESVAVGDIVAFPQDGMTILHRIIEKRGGSWREKGDNRRVGNWISAANCLGKAVRCENGVIERTLDIPSTSIRLRLITFLSRLEGNLFGLLVGGVQKIWHSPASRPVRLLAWLGNAVTLPFRILFGSLLLSVYPTRRLEENEEQLEQLVTLFRALNGRTEKVEWTKLTDLLLAHGLESLAAEGTSEGKTLRYRAGFLFMNSVATLADVHRALAAKKIPFAVLKGPPLARALYGDGALRTSVDVDVLVAPEHRDRALDALQAVGFRVRGSALQQAAVKRGHFHIVLDATVKNRVILELHWALVDRANLYRINESEIRSRWTTARVGDVDVGVLSREDELLYLLLHIAKHGLFNGVGLARGERASWFCRAITGNRLIWYMDVQKYLEKFSPVLDWAALRESSNRWNISDEIFQSLEVLDRLLPDAQAAAALRRLGHEPARVRKSNRNIPQWVMRWMKADEGVTIRPARLLNLGSLFFPAPRTLRNFYDGSRVPLVLLYLWHPVRMTARLWRG